MIEIKFIFAEKKVVALTNNIQIGECNFIEENDTWNIVHTEVSDDYKGQGIARKLVECVMENAKKFNKKLTADCSYAHKIIFP